MTSFDFLFSVVITRSVFNLTLPLTQLLQGPRTDIADATHRVESLKSLTCCKCNTVDTFHKKCYRDILELVSKVVIGKCKPGNQSCNEIIIMSHQNRLLIISKKIVTIPFLYHLIVEI